MTEVVGAELGFEAIGGLALRAGHHAGVPDYDVELLAFGDNPVRRLAHAGERCEIDLHEFDVLHAGIAERAPRFVEIPRGADHGGAVRLEGADRLHAEPGGGARHQDALARQIDVFEDFISGGFRAKRHVSLPSCLAGELYSMSWARTLRLGGEAAPIKTLLLAPAT